MSLLLLLRPKEGVGPPPGTTLIVAPSARATGTSTPPLVAKTSRQVSVPAASATAAAAAPAIGEPVGADYVELRIEDITLGFDNAARPGTSARAMPVTGFKLDISPVGYSRASLLGGNPAQEPVVVAGLSVGASLNMRAYVDDLIFLMATAGWSGVRVSGTDPGGGLIPSDLCGWQFVRSTTRRSPTAQVRVGYEGEGVWLKTQGMACEELRVGHEAQLEATLKGARVMHDPIHIVSGLSSPSVLPLQEGLLSLSWAGREAAVDQWELRLSEPLVVRQSPTGTSAFPTIVEHAPERGSVSGSVSVRTLATADIDALTSGAPFSVLAALRSATRSTVNPAYALGMWVEIPACQYVGGDLDEVSRRRARGGDFNFLAAADNDGTDAVVTLVGTVASLD